MSGTVNSSNITPDGIEGLLRAHLLSNRSRLKQETDVTERQAILFAAERLGMTDELTATEGLAVRARLALLLAPRSAIFHKASERISRHEKIRGYLVSDHGYVEPVASVLATSVASILDAWETERQHVAIYRDVLRSRDGDICQSCRVSFGAPELAASVVTADTFKPTKIDPLNWLSPTVDHIDPVSAFGSNSLENLELLCRMCNSGKEDDSPPMPRHELKFGALLPYGELEEYELPRSGFSYLRKILYLAVKKAGRNCSVESCNSDAELTVRLIRSNGLLILGNLQVLCYECV